ncbi:unnamed protein product [Gordionus sp. m RMFG-2023]
MEINSFLNPLYLDSIFIDSAKNAFSSKSIAVIENELDFSPKPFPHFIFKRFITNQSYLKSLQEELQQINYKHKDNDLYRFNQSKDLKSITLPNVEKLKNIIYKEFKDVIQNITDIPLNDNIDLFAAKYDYSDVLLCHDDQSDGRRFAFIFYLNPDSWQESYGGLLGFFGLNEQNEPDTLITQIMPIWNQMILFEVSDKSYHQVSELKAEGKNRLTISGWFHGTKPLLLHLPSIYFPLELLAPLDFEENALYDWINPNYLIEDIISQIQITFGETSEINLSQFLAEDKYSQLLSYLDGLADECWEIKGPRFRRNYLVVKPSLLNLAKKPRKDEVQAPLHNSNLKNTQTPTQSNNCLRECCNLFGSEAMFLILSNMTGLELHPLAQQSSMDTTQYTTGDGSPSSDNSTTRATKRTESIERNKKREKTFDADKKTSATPVNAEFSDTDIADERVLVDDNPPPSVKKEAEPGSIEDYGSRFQIEVRKFRPGDYTLLNDTSNEIEQKSLNLSLFVGCEDWIPDYGGQVVYVDPKEEEPLLTINPTPNSLALVYNDEGVAHFVKYINNKCTKRPNLPEGKADRAFYQLFFNYFESPEPRCD